MGYFSQVTMGKFKEILCKTETGNILYKAIVELDKRLDNVNIKDKTIYGEIREQKANKNEFVFGENKLSNLKEMNKICDKITDFREVFCLNKGQVQQLYHVIKYNTVGREINSMTNISHIRMNSNDIPLLNKMQNLFNTSEKPSDFLNINMKHINEEIEGKNIATTHKDINGELDTHHLFRDFKIILENRDLGTPVAVFKETATIKEEGREDKKVETIIVLNNTGYATIFNKIEIDKMLYNPNYNPVPTTAYYFNLEKVIATEHLAKQEYIANKNGETNALLNDNNQVYIYANQNVNNGLKEFCKTYNIDVDKMKDQRLENDGKIMVLTSQTMLNKTQNVATKYDKLQDSIDKGLMEFQKSKYDEQDILEFFKSTNMFNAFKDANLIKDN